MSFTWTIHRKSLGLDPLELCCAANTGVQKWPSSEPSKREIVSEIPDMGPGPRGPKGPGTEATEYAIPASTLTQTTKRRTATPATNLMMLKWVIHSMKSASKTTLHFQVKKARRELRMIQRIVLASWLVTWDITTKRGASLGCVLGGSLRMIITTASKQQSLDLREHLQCPKSRLRRGCALGSVERLGVRQNSCLRCEFSRACGIPASQQLWGQLCRMPTSPCSSWNTWSTVLCTIS